MSNIENTTNREFSGDLTASSGTKQIPENVIYVGAPKEAKHDAILRALMQEELFISQERLPYITLHDEKDGIYKTFPILSTDMKAYINHLNYSINGTTTPAKLSAEIIESLESHARTRGKQQNVYYRVASVGGFHYLDLIDDGYNVVRNSAEGWTVGNYHDVKFRRTPNALPLPIPVSCTNGMDLIRPLVNVSNDDQFRLFIGLLVTYLSPGPYPVTFITSQHDSGKTVTTKNMRSIIDPCIAQVTGLPNDEKTLMLMAYNSHILAFDNISSISQAVSDNCCRISSGCGYRVKRMYSDVEEISLYCRVAIIFNSIQDLITSADLGDRVIALELSKIKPSCRLSETEMDVLFKRNHPEILGWLLNCDSWYMATKYAFERPASIFRMADFYRIMHVLETHLGWPAMSFATAYRDNRQSTMDSITDQSVIARHVINLMERTTGNWEGTCQDLLREINRNSPESERSIKAWPRTPQSMSCSMRVIAPNLEEYSIYTRFWKIAGGNRRRMVTMSHTPFVDPIEQDREGN